MQFHRHRIVPGHLGGEYEPRNVVRVNVAMHAFLHDQLWKQHGRDEDRLAREGLLGLIGKDEIVNELRSLSNHDSFKGLESHARVKGSDC